jgi:hypothetical protein
MNGTRRGSPLRVIVFTKSSTFGSGFMDSFIPLMGTFLLGKPESLLLAYSFRRCVRETCQEAANEPRELCGYGIRNNAARMELFGGLSI